MSAVYLTQPVGYGFYVPRNTNNAFKSVLRKIANSGTQLDVDETEVPSTPASTPVAQPPVLTPQNNPNNSTPPQGGANTPTTPVKPKTKDGADKKPYGFFDSLGDMWKFLIARIRMWWYKSRLKSGKLTDEQWKTVNKDAQELSTNRFGRAIGSFINPNKYTEDYYNGIPRFIRGVQRAHEFNRGSVSWNDATLNAARQDVAHMYNWGNKYGLLDDEFNAEYGDSIKNLINPHTSNMGIRADGLWRKAKQGMTNMFSRDE